MNKEEKDLLLKDLCGRLPYGVIVRWESYTLGEVVYCNEMLSCVGKWEQENEWINGVPLADTRPYLRPMDSMTEGEIAEYQYMTERCVCDAGYSIGDNIDWLNARHFDYRGLIKKGLAIAVTEENNPYK